jgi:hypothetical protein
MQFSKKKASCKKKKGPQWVWDKHQGAKNNKRFFAPFHIDKLISQMLKTRWRSVTYSVKEWSVKTNEQDFSVAF